MNKPHGGIIRINCNTRCLLGAACLFSLSATAKIFQCVENGHTRFSEHPCGKAAQEVKVAIPANLGQSVSHEPDEQLQKVTEEIARDNRRRELTRLIARKQSDLKIMHDQFSATMAKLETGLARAKSDYDRSWRKQGLKHKRSRFYDTVRSFKKQIQDTRRKFLARKSRLEDEIRELGKELKDI